MGTSKGAAFVCVLASALGVLSAISPQARGEDSISAAEVARRKAVDAVFAQYTRPGSPGVSVGIYRDGEVPYLKSYGLADLEQGTPLTPQSEIHIASTSKQFTAFAIALLARDGRVDLNEDVHRYLPWLPDYGRRVTVADLIHHTSGIKDQWSLMTLAGRDYRDVLKQQQILHLVARQRSLDFEPGSESEYSNTNYTLLGVIVHAVSGKTLREFTTERIFKPLGMTRTFFYDSLDEVVPARAQSYERSADGHRWLRSVLSYETVGATSLLTTAEDMVKWARNFAHPTVGDAALIRQITAPAKLNDSTPITYGFGLQRASFAGHEVVVHEGSDAAFTSSFTYYPQERFAVAILANTVIDSTWKPATSIANIYLNGGAGTPIDNAPAAAPADPKRLAGASGTYLNEFRPLTTLSVKNNELWMSTPGGSPERAIFRGNGTFDFGDQIWTYYRLQRDAQGSVRALEEISARDLGRSRVYIRAEPDTPSAAQLAELEGSYRSNDLDITYTVAVAGGRLTMSSVWRTEPVVLIPSVRDRFDSPEFSLRSVIFERDLSGHVTSLRVHTSRARNLRFMRVPVAQPEEPIADNGACAALLKLPLEGEADSPVKITAAVLAGASTANAEDWQAYMERSHEMGAPLNASKRIPSHCRVSGYVAPGVRFELRLPASANWNGKFLLGACSGWCGQLHEGFCVSGLTRGYASATTDGGHVGLSAFDGVWAFNNRQAEEDFGYRANHVVAQAAKAVVRAYYGREARYSYLAGCSKGGQAGLMAAQRYPADFDGIVANGPVLDYQGDNALRLTWIARAVTDASGRPILSAARVPLIQRAVMQQCDGLDGVRDGLIDDPRRCRFEPRTLLCRSGQAADQCLTADEVNALRLVYAPPQDSSGKAVYPTGTIPGSEGSWPGWLLPVDGNIRTRAYVGAEQYLKYLAFESDPGVRYGIRDFDYDRDVERLQPLSPIFDAIDPDLSAFAAHGGKLIMLHGWADAAISPLMTVKYYEEVIRHMGGLEPTQKFARLFMMPGAYHCGGGPGPSAADALWALEAWRESGIAPTKLVAGKDDDLDGVVEGTRAIYPYQATEASR